jgi:polysaccharide export outer membrane protein
MKGIVQTLGPVCSLAALAGCVSNDLVDTGAVAVVDASVMPSPAQSDIIATTRPSLIGPGDALAIEVFGLAELSREVRVDSNGSISLPLAGSISVIGDTPDQVAEKVEERLRANFVRDPRVSVGVTETVSQVVTIDGEVGRPGIYPIIGRSTLMRSIARAEGTSEFADVNHVVVFRTVEGRPMAALYDLRAIRQAAYADPEIYANDVIVVSESQARRIFPMIATAASVLLTPLVAILDNN